MARSPNMPGWKAIEAYWLDGNNSANPGAAGAAQWRVLDPAVRALSAWI